MMLALVRHAESTENATKNTGFYQDPRPWTGPAAHALSRDLVGLTPCGFRQSVWLAKVLPELVGAAPQVFTSEYRRAIDTAAIAFPAPPGRPQMTGLLNEMHYGDVTYMTLRELFATYPEGAEDRRSRKHLWTPPGPGGESLAVGVLARATEFAAVARQAAGDREAIVAVTHLTAIMALRAVLEHRPVEELVSASRNRKMPNAAVLRYELRGDDFHLIDATEPTI
ncbi:histidine phosphatase family protein [Streptomyces sp. NPDC002082]|uniref:histidine phosphatase family protein n=1 Tax=Streptomyces sp. NPDC002082 TaxID=3154772 RepID=UPI003319625D